MWRLVGLWTIFLELGLDGAHQESNFLSLVHVVRHTDTTHLHPGVVLGRSLRLAQNILEHPVGDFASLFDSAIAV